jgi:hypothetical protein
MHCIHTNKRCLAGEPCGLYNGHNCTIITQAQNEHKAPQHYDYKGYFVPVEKLDASVMAMLQTFNED